ncbi:MAG TPA: hypothetical protein VJ728_14565 [Candidatus Binataceae bacterium]|nr:hypothetical protein [Candidatus Binataceae bacterium]
MALVDYIRNAEAPLCVADIRAAVGQILKSQFALNATVLVEKAAFPELL